MRSIALLLAVFVALASAAAGGPWPRGEGKVFVSSSAYSTWPAGRPLELPDIYGAAYAEYGLTNRITFGVDLGTPDYQNTARAKAIGSLRFTLSAPDASLQTAFDIGGGMDQGTGVLRLGGSLGRGFSVGDLSGWMTLDGTLHHAPKRNESAYGLDLTVGVNRSRMKYIAQLSAYQSYSGTPYVSLTPSIVRKFGKKTHIEIGASLGLKNKPDPALKLGIWQEF